MIIIPYKEAPVLPEQVAFSLIGFVEGLDLANGGWPAFACHYVLYSIVNEELHFIRV